MYILYSGRNRTVCCWLLFIYLSKSYTTIFTFGLHLLPCITFCTYEFCQCFSIEVMILVFVVTVSTFVEFSAARRLKKNNHQKQTNRNHHHCYATESSNRNLYYHYFYVSLFIEKLNALLWRIQVTGNLRQYSLFHSERDSGIFIVNGARRHTRSA